jgi:hypothetical protein
VDGEWSGCRKQFGEGNAGEDKGCSYEGTAAKMLVQDEEGGQAGEDWFEGEEDRGVGRGKVLLRPALDGEGSGSGEETSDDECDQEMGRDRKVWPST